MITIHLVLDLVAFILVLLAALRIQAPRVDLGWLGLALFILNTIFIASSK